MITIKAGNYHTLTELSAKFSVSPKEMPKMKTRISRIARRLKLGLYLNRLSVRYHDDDLEKISEELRNGAKQ